MTPDVKDILQVIENFSIRQKIGMLMAETKLEKILLFLAASSLIAAITLLFFERTRMAALIAGLVFLLTINVLVLVQALSVAATFLRPLKGYADEAETRFKLRIAFIAELATFPAESLEMARKALESDLTRMQKRLFLLVGAVDKAGFIPAGLALYYAAAKAQSGANDIPANLLMAFIFGLYGGAFLGHRLLEALNFNITCLQEAHDISARRDQFR